MKAILICVLLTVTGLMSGSTAVTLRAAPPAGASEPQDGLDGDAAADEAGRDGNEVPPDEAGEIDGSDDPPGRRRESREFRPRRPRTAGPNRPGDRRLMERGHRHDDGPIPPELEARILEVISTRLPEWNDRLNALRDRHPERYRRTLRRIFPMMREFIELHTHHPEMADAVIEEFQVEQDVRKWAESLRAMPPDSPEAGAIADKIRNALTRQHDLQMQRRRFRLEQFRARLEREQRRLAKEESRLELEAAQFGRILDERMRLIGEGKIREAFGPRWRGEAARRPRRVQRPAVGEPPQEK